MREPPTWQEAAAACRAKDFRLAAAVLCRRIELTDPPLAALGAVLAVYYDELRKEEWEKNVGFSLYDRNGGVALGEAIQRKEHLSKWEVRRCEKLARRYAAQVMKSLWGTGAGAAQRLERLFDGACPYTGDALEWGSEPESDLADDADADADFGAASDGEDEDEELSAGEEEEEEEADYESTADYEGDEAVATPVPSPSPPRDPAAARAPRSTAAAVERSAPSTVLASAASRDALAARKEALQEAWEAAQAHADALKGSLAAVTHQLATAERRAARDAEAARQAEAETHGGATQEVTPAPPPPLAAPPPARRAARVVQSTLPFAAAAAPRVGRLQRVSAAKASPAQQQPQPPRSSAAVPARVDDDGSDSELPSVPAGVLAKESQPAVDKHPARTRADYYAGDTEEDEDDEGMPAATRPRKRKLRFSASDGDDA